MEKIITIRFADRFGELRKPNRKHEPCYIQMSPKAEVSNLLAKVFSKNSNFNYYNIDLYYGGSLNNYADLNYYNILKMMDLYITDWAKESIYNVGHHYKYFICHMNFVIHYFLLPLWC